MLERKWLKKHDKEEEKSSCADVKVKPCVSCLWLVGNFYRFNVSSCGSRSSVLLFPNMSSSRLTLSASANVELSQSWKVGFILSRNLVSAWSLFVGAAELIFISNNPALPLVAVLAEHELTVLTKTSDVWACLWVISSDLSWTGKVSSDTSVLFWLRLLLNFKVSSFETELSVPMSAR